jgi:hypothetical protein
LLDHRLAAVVDGIDPRSLKARLKRLEIVGMSKPHFGRMHGKKPEKLNVVPFGRTVFERRPEWIRERNKKVVACRAWETGAPDRERMADVEALCVVVVGDHSEKLNALRMFCRGDEYEFAMGFRAKK